MIRQFVASQYPDLFPELEQVPPNLFKTMTETFGMRIVPDEEISPDFVDHTFVGVKFVTNRVVSHEMVRHRPLAILQESQRFCAYNKEKFGGEVTFIDPRRAFPKINYDRWKEIMGYCENAYLSELKETKNPEAARTQLPNSCKTEIIIYTSLRQWSHIFAMRTTKTCDASMIEAMVPVWTHFRKIYPGQFDVPQRSEG